MLRLRSVLLPFVSFLPTRPSLHSLAHVVVHEARKRLLHQLVVGCVEQCVVCTTSREAAGRLCWDVKALAKWQHARPASASTAGAVRPAASSAPTRIRVEAEGAAHALLKLGGVARQQQVHGVEVAVDRQRAVHLEAGPGKQDQGWDTRQHRRKRSTHSSSWASDAGARNADRCMHIHRSSGRAPASQHCHPPRGTGLRACKSRRHGTCGWPTARAPAPGVHRGLRHMGRRGTGTLRVQHGRAVLC